MIDSPILPTFNDQHHAQIPPVPAGEPRPTWSVLIPTYNCGDYLREALGSVLRQDAGPEEMQIIVVDDHSTEDDPESVVRELGGDRAEFIRQERNVGKVRNYETGLKLSRGRLIHQLHGDDRVKPGFYLHMAELFEECPRAGAAFCRSEYIDGTGDVQGKTTRERSEYGYLSGWLDKILVEQRIQTPSIVLKREVYEHLGGFDRRLDSSEDWEMWIRVACFYPFAFQPLALAQYRSWDENNTSRTLRSGERIRTLHRMVNIVDTYVPSEVRDRVSQQRRASVAHQLIGFIPRLVAERRFEVLTKLYPHILLSDWSPRTIYHMLYFTVNAESLL